MARTAITVQPVTIAGLAPSYTTVLVADGFSFPNMPLGRIAHIKNTGAATLTVTLVATGKIAGVSLTNPTFTINAGADKVVAGFDSAAFNQSDGTVWVDLSGATTVTVAVLSHSP